MADVTTAYHPEMDATDDYGEAVIEPGSIAVIGTMALLNASGRHEHDAADRSVLTVAGVIDAPPMGSGWDYANPAGTTNKVRYRRNVVVRYEKDGTHTPTAAHNGKPGYAKYNATISTDPADGPYAGPILGLDGDRVKIQIVGGRQPVGAADPASLFAAAQTLTALVGPEQATGKRYYPVNAASAIAITHDLLPDGDAGDEMILLGSSDSNTITFSPGANLHTQDGNDRVLGASCLFHIVHDGTRWQEVSFSANAATAG